MSEWRDIASAPRDGSVIILFFPTYAEGEQVGAYRYDDIVEPAWDGINGYQLADGEDAPTHWQPLPAPPRGLDERGDR